MRSVHPQGTFHLFGFRSLLDIESNAFAHHPRNTWMTIFGWGQDAAQKTHVQRHGQLWLRLSASSHISHHIKTSDNDTSKCFVSVVMPKQSTKTINTKESSNISSARAPLRAKSVNGDSAESRTPAIHRTSSKACTPVVEGCCKPSLSHRAHVATPYCRGTTIHKLHRCRTPRDDDPQAATSYCRGTTIHKLHVVTSYCHGTPPIHKRCCCAHAHPQEASAMIPRQLQALRRRQPCPRRT